MNTERLTKEDILKKHFKPSPHNDWTPHILKAMEEYARECVKASLEKAAENGKVEYKGNLMSDPSTSSKLFHPDGSEFSLSKSSITDSSNIVLL